MSPSLWLLGYRMTNIPLTLAICAVLGQIIGSAIAAEECEDVSSYYAGDVDSFTSTSGNALREVLRQRISSPYTLIPYSSSAFDARDALEILDKTSTCCVTELYTRAESPISSADWNREHIWPKSLGLGTTGPDYSDIINLRAADMNVNSARQNLVYGNCPGCGVGHAEAPLTKKNRCGSVAWVGVRGVCCVLGCDSC
jgi:hypothetical protein